ncbi:hypothetical protein C4D60_Mb09t16840 [Musa balbisiana]|uniref:FLZ-type domain-containing protein n=1 Tax=Musa balbisiana TaxID=52838 RepID=A0A4S8IHQ7_MUSBA|nr:hypothetical protein C4D60_Mb09t16840 [Musa balbisiana]
MLPRTESIFHLGEEEGGEAPESAAAITEIDCTKYEGLRILIQRSGRPSNYVVIKSLLKPPFTPMASPPRFGFLRACCFCKRELSLHKDVYMYRAGESRDSAARNAVDAKSCKMRGVNSERRRGRGRRLLFLIMLPPELMILADAGGSQQ